MNQQGGIQSTIRRTFLAVAMVITLVLSWTLYLRFLLLSRETALRSTKGDLEITAASLEDYLLGMRRVSDAIAYHVIRKGNVSSEEMQRELELLYESNKDQIVTVALYDSFGSLITAEPVAVQKENPDVTRQSWFISAQNEIENLHFSTPHIQNLFEDAAFRYHWVISLSREVDLPRERNRSQGVLLVDIDYGMIEQIMSIASSEKGGRYYYLTDPKGSLIWHPEQVELSSGLREENNREDAALSDGVHQTSFQGKKRTVVVRTLGYTGWKLIGVIPDHAGTYGIRYEKYFILLFIIGTEFILLFVCRTIADKISRPILQLNDAVGEYEKAPQEGKRGAAQKIPIAGPPEIGHLGSSIRRSYLRIGDLMEEIVRQQNERRRSELAALQSQINPHFLYNTLDSITWMVESGHNQGAAKMITELGRLLRISISKGHSIIRLREEIQHAKSYMNIQRVRYGDRFQVEFLIDPVVEDDCTVKLILQPLLENAIYYGVGEMDPEDGGKILVKALLEKEGSRICLVVEDNGMGMKEEEVENLLSETGASLRHGNGVGLLNVHHRIQLLFGEPYGIQVESEPDAGTKVMIFLPVIPYSEEKREELERGKSL